MITKKIFFGVVIYLAIATNYAMARQWFIEPEVLIAGGYEDNPFFVTDIEDVVIADPAGTNETGGQGFGEFSGRIRLGSESESDLIAFDAAAFTRRFFEDSILDNDRLLATFRYDRTGLKHDGGIVTGYVKRNSISSFLGTPGSDIVLDDFGRFRGDRDQEELFVRPSLTSRFSTSLVGVLSAGYRDVTYDEPVDTSTEFEEFVAQYQLRQTLSERTVLHGTAGVLLYRPTEPVDVGEVEEANFLDLLLGVDYIASERATLFFAAGPGEVERERLEPGGGRVNFSESTEVVSAGIRFTGERSEFTANYSKGIESVGLSGGVTDAERFSFAYSRPETFGGDFGIAARYLKREPVDVLTLEREYFTVTPSMSWSINQYLSLLASIQYRHEEIIDEITGLSDTADSTIYRVGARYAWGRKLIRP